MYVVILGGGAVGGSIADVLHRHASKMTVVDENAETLKSFERKYDGCTTIQGNAARPSVLEKANTNDADMVIAVTGVDEVNIIAAEIAREVYSTTNIIARLRSDEYEACTKFKTAYLKNVLIINPERVIGEQIEQLAKYPHTLEIASFQDAKITIVGFKTRLGYAPTGISLASISGWRPTPNTRFLAAFRTDRWLSEENNDVVLEDDEVYLLVADQELERVMTKCHGEIKKKKKICIAGGGHIGTKLALALQKENTVRLIEQDPVHAREASHVLNNGIVYTGDATDSTLLNECEMEDTDMFIAVTNNDEINLMSCLTAKKEGTKRAVSLVSHDNYLRLISETSIDVAFSPQRSTASSVLAQLHSRSVQSARRLRLGTSEIFETVLRGTSKANKVVGSIVADLELPANARLGTIIRGNQMIEIAEETTFQENDHLIFFVADGTDVRKILAFLQPSAFSFV